MRLREVLVIVNPVAGKGLGKSVIKYFSRGKNNCLVKVTESHGHAVDLAKEAALAGFSVVYSCGGDGTLNEISNGLLLANVENLPVVGIIPVGSGNDVAASLKIRKLSACHNIDRYLEAEHQKKILIDLIKIETEDKHFYATNLVSFGFSADIAEAVSALERRNQLMYLAKALAKVWSAEPLELGLNGFPLKVLDFYITNGRRVGGVLRIAPRSSMIDGILEYTGVRPISKLNRFSYVLAGVLGNLRKRGKVVAGEISRCPLEIRFYERVKGEIDGEPIFFDPGIIKISVERQRMPILAGPV